MKVNEELTDKFLAALKTAVTAVECECGYFSDNGDTVRIDGKFDKKRLYDEVKKQNCMG